MKPYLTFLLSISFLFTTQALWAQAGNQIEPEVKAEVQSSLTNLSHYLDQFELFQKKLDASGQNHRSYDENKNIWISTVLAVQAISSICENEQDLLNLFWDLRKSRRVQYVNIRIRSLETSIQQIHNMMEQIRINHRLLPPDLAEIHLLNKIAKNAEATIALFQSSIALIKKQRPY